MSRPFQFFPPFSHSKFLIKKVFVPFCSLSLGVSVVESTISQDSHKTLDSRRSPSENDRMTALTGWTNFFVIVGSSAGALIGLQFVVITLVAGMPRVQKQPQAGSAYATPTIVHFATVLLLSAALSAPWPHIRGAAILWGLVGLAGMAYSAITARRLRTHVYNPVFEDWMFHAILPFTAYTTLAASAWEALPHEHEALFAVAAGLLVLLFIGIHNAWDAVTYHVFVKGTGPQDES